MNDINNKKIISLLLIINIKSEVTRLIFKYFSFKNCHIAMPARNLFDYKAVMDMAILYF